MATAKSSPFNLLGQNWTYLDILKLRIGHPFSFLRIYVISVFRTFSKLTFAADHLSTSNREFNSEEPHHGSTQAAFEKHQISHGSWMYCKMLECTPMWWTCKFRVTFSALTFWWGIVHEQLWWQQNEELMFCNGMMPATLIPLSPFEWETRRQKLSTSMKRNFISARDELAAKCCSDRKYGLKNITQTTSKGKFASAEISVTVFSRKHKNQNCFLIHNKHFPHSAGTAGSLRESSLFLATHHYADQNPIRTKHILGSFLLCFTFIIQ